MVGTFAVAGDNLPRYELFKPLGTLSLGNNLKDRVTDLSHREAVVGTSGK